MAKKKIFLDSASDETRRKTLEELKKQKDITIEDGEAIAGGAPVWLETPGRDDDGGKGPSEEKGK